MSGSSSSTRHSATRRFSPPDSVVHIRVRRRQSQRIHRDLDLAVELPQILRVDLLLHLRLLLEQLRHLVVRHRLGELHRDLLELLEQRALLLHRDLDVSLHVLRRIELRLLRQVADARAFGGHASP